MVVEKLGDDIGGRDAVVPVRLPAHRGGRNDNIQSHEYNQNPSDNRTGFDGKTLDMAL